jgi:hypothetical protein
MKLIFSKAYIPDYSQIKDLENRKNDDILDENNIKLYEIDKLQLMYLKSVCLKKLKKLNFLSFKLKVSLINIVEIYCDLCFKEITNNRNKELEKKNEKELLFNRQNGINIINKKFHLMPFGNKKKQKINKTLLNNLLKSEISPLNKNKKQGDDVITHIISKQSNVIDLFGKKSNSVSQKILYCNSFTRLFIGETDKESILQRHLSNILVLKQNNLNINGSYVDLSRKYLKTIFTKIYKKNSRKLMLDEVLKNTLEKYKVNQKYLDEYNKNDPKKKKLMKTNNKIKKINQILDFPLKNKEKIEEHIIKTFNYNKSMDNYKKGHRNNSSAKSTKIRNFLNLHSKKNKIKKENDSTFLIDNLCKVLSETEYIPKKINKKKSKNKLWIKTDNSSVVNNKYYNIGKRSNDSYHNNTFRTNISKNYQSSIKKYSKNFIFKKDYFLKNNTSRKFMQIEI